MDINQIQVNWKSKFILDWFKWIYEITEDEVDNLELLLNNRDNHLSSCDIEI